MSDQGLWRKENPSNRWPRASCQWPGELSKALGTGSSFLALRTATAASPAVEAMPGPPAAACGWPYFPSPLLGTHGCHSPSCIYGLQFYTLGPTVQSNILLVQKTPVKAQQFPKCTSDLYKNLKCSLYHVSASSILSQDTIQTIPTINGLGKLQVKEKRLCEKDLERHETDNRFFLLFISLFLPSITTVLCIIVWSVCSSLKLLLKWIR